LRFEARRWNCRRDTIIATGRPRRVSSTGAPRSTSWTMPGRRSRAWAIEYCLGGRSSSIEPFYCGIKCQPCLYLRADHMTRGLRMLGRGLRERRRCVRGPFRRSRGGPSLRPDRP
jgi:hypothetical protein